MDLYSTREGNYVITRMFKSFIYFAIASVFITMDFHMILIYDYFMGSYFPTFWCQVEVF